MDRPSTRWVIWAPLILGVVYLGVVVYIVQFSASRTTTFDEFSQYWGLFGTLVGVATGAIPSFFFKTQADRADQRAGEANARAENAIDRASDAIARAERYALVVDPVVGERIAAT